MMKGMEPFPFENLGHLPSPKDNRDFTIDKVNKVIGYAAAPIPVPYFTDLSKIPVLMQSHQPACVSHVTSAGMMFQDNGAYSFDYSPRFLHALCKKEDGVPDQDGTYYRQAFKEAQTYGVADNAQFPNDVALPLADYKDASLIPKSAYDVAKDRKIKSYVMLTDLSFAAIKQAIYQNKLVLLGVKLGQEWWTATNGITSWLPADILPLRPPASIVSGHAVLAYGYDEKYIYIRNSWSTDWGQNGTGYFGIEYNPFIQEAWTFMDLAPEVVANLKTQLSLAQRILQLLSDWIKGRNTPTK
jgi:hypothetical protein